MKTRKAEKCNWNETVGCDINAAHSTNECYKSEPHHTPGPWKANKYNGNVEYPFSVCHEKGTRSWQVCGVAVQAGEEEANARLIAAAPDLLEALKEVKAVFEASGAVEPFKAQYEAVCKAIAKAEGHPNNEGRD